MHTIAYEIIINIHIQLYCINLDIRVELGGRIRRDQCKGRVSQSTHQDLCNNTGKLQDFVIQKIPLQ